MVDIGYIPSVKAPWLNRPSGKIQSKRDTGREHEKPQRDKNRESKDQTNDATDRPHFDGYA